MRVLWFLRGGINQARVRRRVLRLEILDRFKVGRVGHDLGEPLKLIELIQLCLAFLRFDNCSAHDLPPFLFGSKTHFARIRWYASRGHGTTRIRYCSPKEFGVSTAQSRLQVLNRNGPA